jgi:hypothetical protein
MKRFTLVVFTAFLATIPAVAEPVKPTVEFRLKPIGELAPILEYGGALFGQADAGQQFAALLKEFTTNEKGYDGINLSRPIGAYLSLAQQLEDSMLVLMIPVADSKTVIDAITGKYGLAVKQGDGGLFSLDLPNVPGTVYIRFQDKYAYVTLRNEKAIDPKGLIAAKDFFSEKTAGILTMTAHIDRLPDDLKKMVYGQLEMQLKEHQSKLAPSASQKLVNDFLTDVGVDAAKTVLLDGQKLTATFDIDPKTDDVKLSASLTAKDGSTLEKTLVGFGNRESTAAGMARAKGSMIAIGLNFLLPTEAKAKFTQLSGEIVKQAVNDAKEGDKPMVKMLADALLPTLNSGDVQLGMAWLPESGKKIGLNMGVRSVRGTEIEKLAKLAGAFIPKQQGVFKGDVETIETRKIHSFQIGDSLKNTPFSSGLFWILTSDDLVAVTTGDRSETVKAVVTTKPSTMPMLSFEVAMTRSLPLMSNPLGEERTAKLVASVFGDNKAEGQDTLKVTATGGKRLDVTASIKGKALALFAAIDRARKED